MSAIPPPNLYDRILAALKLIIRGELAELSFSAQAYEYTVQAVTSVETENGTSCIIDGTPSDSTLSLPAIANVPCCPGLLAENVVASVGMLCRVRFVNGSPSRPEVIGFIGGVDASGALFGSGSPAARVSDVVTCTFPPGVGCILTGVMAATPPVPIAGPFTVSQLAVGSISTGSSKLTVGG
jgi:hypothetical protein